jgi:hypothetical protein
MMLLSSEGTLKTERVEVVRDPRGGIQYYRYVVDYEPQGSEVVHKSELVCIPS